MCKEGLREVEKLPLDESGLPPPDFHTFHLDRSLRHCKDEISTAHRTGEKLLSDINLNMMAFNYNIFYKVG